MNLKAKGTANTVIFEMYKELFKSNKQHIDEIKKSIINKQYSLSNSPNYFFMGKVYMANKIYNVPPLHPTLTKTAKAYITALSQYEADTKLFNVYATYVSSSILHISDIYFMYPTSVHKYFEGIPKPDDEPEYIQDIKPNNYEEIELIITDQLMYSLLN